MIESILTDENTVSLDEYKAAVRDEQPALLLPPDEEGEQLLSVYKRQLDRIDIEIDELHEQRFVETAYGPHLERIGGRYDIDRKTNESDEKLRKRIEAARNVAQSRGTYKDVAQVALDVLDADGSQIQLKRPAVHNEEGLIIVTVDSNVLNDSPFTNNEIASLLDQAVVGGHRVRIEQSDAFRFGDPDNGWGTEWGKVIE